MRDKCYSCFRPSVTCLCQEVTPVETNVKFVILMHPMEHRKVKNNTGRITHLSLPNSEIIIDIDFSNNERVNEIISDNDSYVLYPGKDSHNLDSGKEHPVVSQKSAIFIIDATWPCAKKMMKLSSNLQCLPKVSFQNDQPSAYHIKRQPNKLCLSTIEAVDKILSSILPDKTYDSQKFLNPFYKMIEYQIECEKDPDRSSYRSSKPDKMIKDKNKVFVPKSGTRQIIFEKSNYY